MNSYNYYREIYLYMVVNKFEQFDEYIKSHRKIHEAINVYDDYIYNKEQVNKKVFYKSIGKLSFITSLIMLCLVILFTLALPEILHEPIIFSIIILSGVGLVCALLTGISLMVCD